MDAIFEFVAPAFDAVNQHFEGLFAVMCGLLAAAWINVK